MRRRRATSAAAAAAAGLVFLVAGSATAIASSPAASTSPVIRWGKAQPVPGVAALNVAGNAQVSSIACVPRGGCVAGGFYTDDEARQQAFVVTEVNGRWSTAHEFPGTAKLNAGGHAAVNAISCAPGGDCAAAGYYTDANGEQEAFVATDVNGRWDSAQEVPGTSALNIGGYASTVTVSCARGGDCVGGGYYQRSNPPGTGTNNFRAFLVSSVKGHWGRAEEVPGTDALNTGRDAQTLSVSCPAAGDCTAGGFYTGAYVAAMDVQIPFLVTQRNGRWASAKVPPGMLASKAGGLINAVSCTSVGACTAAGQYQSSSSHAALVVSERNGRWGSPTLVPGTRTLSGASATSLSCLRAGNCAVVGSYARGTFAASEQSGHWAHVVLLGGSAAVANASVTALWCASPGNCVASGFTEAGQDLFNNIRWGAFLLGERNGRWSQGESVPDLGPPLTANNGSNQTDSVSCSAAGKCFAGGFYMDPTGHLQAFVVGTR